MPTVSLRDVVQSVGKFNGVVPGRRRRRGRLSQRPQLPNRESQHPQLSKAEAATGLLLERGLGGLHRVRARFGHVYRRVVRTIPWDLVDCEGVRPTSEVLRTLRRLEEWNE
ncbi:hypothetical protein [Methanopyrus kandleri]